MINQDEVASIVQQHSGTPMFEELLRSSDSPEKILRLLALYAEFNFDAGPCIAALTAQITSQRSLFLDRSATLFPDRSYEVASCIFDAAVDEFVGRSKKHSMTHRDMVQRMVLVAARYFSVDPATLAKMLDEEQPRLAEISRRFGEGYGLGQPINAESTFRAIGFHIGQELCGHDEFNTLFNAMKAHHGDLYSFLQAERVSAWIVVHITAEQDHFEQAFMGAKRAFEYCTDDRVDVLSRCVLEGIEDFARVQHDFMRLVATPAASA
ncbi:MAG: hypothetical protein RIT28_1623 [Pseudomonadota bacterium]